MNNLPRDGESMKVMAVGISRCRCARVHDVDEYVSCEGHVWSVVDICDQRQSLRIFSAGQRR